MSDQTKEIQSSLWITLEESCDPVQGGASLDNLVRVLQGISQAMRLMAGHLSGREKVTGRPPAWIREQSRLHISRLTVGSVSAELTASPPPSSELALESLGERAIAAFRKWDGIGNSDLPRSVADCFHGIASDLEGDAHLYLGNREQPRKTLVTPRQSADIIRTGTEPALLAGWLREVNWERESAQLHDSNAGYVQLRFSTGLADDMQRLARQFVEVRGQGRLNRQGDWSYVKVEELSQPPSWQESFDLGDFLNDPNPKLFDPEMIPTIDLTDEEWEAYSRSTREGRES